MALSPSRKASDAGDQVEDGAERAADNVWVDRLGRFGFAAKGVLHLLIAGLAGSVGFLGGGEDASQTGAISSIAEQPYGTALLIALAVGLAGYALMRLLHVVINPSGEDGAKGLAYRASYLVRAIIYGGLTVVTIGELQGSGGGGGGGDSEQSATQRLLELPAGAVLVGAVSLILFVVGATMVKKAIDGSFMEVLEGRGGRVRRFALLTGRIGHAARALVFGALGVLFAQAALSSDSDQAGGMDEALQSLASTPAGTGLLTATAIGLAAYGLFCFAEARWADISTAG